MIHPRLLKLIPERIRRYFEGALLKRSFTASQGGQDLWVYGEVFNEKKDGYFVDIGAHDGVYLSNTYLLEKRYAWTGICVEANPETFSNLTRNRSSKCLNYCLDAEERTVIFAKRGVMGGIVADDTRNPQGPGADLVQLKTVTLGRMLRESGAPPLIDYLSIDIEGAEERVLADFDFLSYRFKCITIEEPSARLRELFRRNGYILVKDIPGLDAFYVHQDFKDEYLLNVYRYYRKKFTRFRWA
jgi:FkbM family methyltransferase